VSIRFVPDKTVEVAEIPFEDQVRLPGEKTALIVVDMQNDFVKEEGNLVVPAAREIVPGIQRLLEMARERGVRVVYTQDTHMEDDPEWDNWPSHVKKDTWGWQIVDELEPRAKDLIILKNRYDAFYGTWLNHFLCHLWGMEHVTIVGTVSNICVLHTAASAGLRFFHIVVPANGVAALNDFDQALTLRQVSWLYRGSVVRDVDDIHFEA